jgi:hypothetical protein
MMHPKVVLVIGFGNLSAKLLPLHWTFPFLRFEFVEQHGEYFRKMRQVFQEAGSLEDLMKAPVERLHPNLQAFRETLSRTPNFAAEAAANRDVQLSTLFANHVLFDGVKTGFTDDDFNQLRSCHRDLICRLLEYDRSEVLLYLATRPDRYLESLKRYASFSSCVAIDKPLATDEHSLAQMRRFARINPELAILPIDHYLFKLDFTRFNEELERRGGLNPREIKQLDVTIWEENLDEFRPFFRDTGIIRDMMPHVATMVSLLFRHYHVTRATVGNVMPLVHYYGLLPEELPTGASPTGPKDIPVIVQAKIELNYGTSQGYLPVSIRIAKGMPKDEVRKDIVITWHTGQHTTINLARKADKGEYVDWAGALKYLMKDWPLLEPMRRHLTFDRACEITADVLACQEQADRKVLHRLDRKPPPHHDAREGLTFFKHPNSPSPPRRVFVFNFDGVVVNTEEAHCGAWKSWHEVIGQNPPDDLAAEPWYEPGRSNREMVSRALAYLHETDETVAGFAIQYGEKYYRLFAHILREAKLEKLEASLPGRHGPASAYHDNVLRFLRLLRQFNQNLVLVTTNDALLVHQTLDQLLQPDDGRPPVGFDRYYVGQRNGVQTYEQIIGDYRSKWGKDVEFVIFDDYLTALKRLRQSYPGDKTVQLIHMDTMKNIRKEEPTTEDIERHEDFEQLIDKFVPILEAGQTQKPA